MLYECNVCNRQFKKKCHYIDHLNRKNPCVKNGVKKQENSILISKIEELNKSIDKLENEKITETNNDTHMKKNKCIFKDCQKQSNFNLANKTKALYCFEHKKENMINVKNKRCIFDSCIKQPTFNLPDQKKALYCFEHKKENMVNVKSKRCIHDDCMKLPAFNLANETKALYCFEHKKENMINIKSKICQEEKCKNEAIYGYEKGRAQYCLEHKKDKMINIILENKCNILECENEYEFIVNKVKYCSYHNPDKNHETNIKRLCKYCDIKEESNYICNECNKIKNKKEWSIVRYLRMVIDTNFEYNSSKMLQGCSKKRPDIYFELDKHCLIVEIDENQHNTYEDSCECSRINEIVNGIGGKSIIIIRYNPDIIRNKGKIIEIKSEERIDLLVKNIKEELVKDYEKFIVKIIQLYYDDNYEEYKKVKEEEITKLVCI